MLYNPHRNYDKGMDDAYMGREPSSNSGQYAEGYLRAMEIEHETQDEEENCGHHYRHTQQDGYVYWSDCGKIVGSQIYL